MLIDKLLWRSRANLSSSALWWGWWPADASPACFEGFVFPRWSPAKKLWLCTPSWPISSRSKKLIQPRAQRRQVKKKKNPKFSSYRESEINLELFDVVQKWPDDEVWRWRAGSILNWRRWPTFAERFDLAGSKLTGAIDFDFSFDWHVFRWIFLHFLYCFSLK